MGKRLFAYAVLVTLVFHHRGLIAQCQAEVKVEHADTGAAVTIDGKPFAEYRIKAGHQPVIWPILGPSGQPMTRQWPLGEKLPTERDDHPHHRSLWFNHGAVNGKDFWREDDVAGADGQENQIVHRDFEKLESGKTATIVTRNDWTSDGKKVCEDQRIIQFGVDEHGRWIDFAAVVTASEGDLLFGDTKEGAFGLRVAGTMDVVAKQGGKIVNSRGQENEAAWGRSADWVDYSGPVDGKPAGIAIFDMPDSFRHPTRWHVRTYGLFAANPFGEKEFEVEDSKQGDAKIAQGDSLKVHYRVLFHDGTLSPAELTKINEEYAATAPCPCE
jgi:hypothetical protein